MRASQVFEKHRQQIRELADSYSEKGITNFRVFGSVADGTDTETSDIDFLVDAAKDVSLLTMGGLYSDLEDILEREIDVLVSSAIPKYFKSKILEKAVSI